MERLYAVQDEVQDWLASSAQQVEGWPRFDLLVSLRLTRRFHLGSLHGRRMASLHGAPHLDVTLAKSTPIDARPLCLTVFQEPFSKLSNSIMLI